MKTATLSELTDAAEKLLDEAGVDFLLVWRKDGITSTTIHDRKGASVDYHMEPTFMDECKQAIKDGWDNDGNPIRAD